MVAARRVLISPAWCLAGLLCAAGARRAEAQSLPLRRVPSSALEVPAGVAVVRDSAAWTVLWRRFEGVRWSKGGTLAHAPIPPVDFRRHVLAAVSLGATSGCVNAARYIRRVVERPDSLVVEFGFEREGGVLTCAMMIAPVDVVRLRRSAKPVAFHPVSEGLAPPPPAPWWDRPAWADYDRTPPGGGRVPLAVLARDPRNTEADVREIARRAGAARDGTAAAVLLERPEVGRDAAVLADLALASDRVRRLFVERHLADPGTLALARDGRTARPVLEMLLGAVPEPNDRELVRALGENPAVRGDSALLSWLIVGGGRHRDLCADALRAFLARWPRTIQLGGGSSRTVACY